MHSLGLWRSWLFPPLVSVALATGCGSSDESTSGSNGVTSTTAGSGGAAGAGGSAVTTGGAGGGGGTIDTSPITADANTWTWVPFDNASCGNGSPTGLGINPTSTSNKVVVFLQGGGACYSTSTCTGTMPSASNFDGFGQPEFDDFATTLGGQGLFDRSDANNPFRDYSFIFIPYCTGDLHAGNKVVGGLHFVGQQNLKAFLPRIVSTFATADQFVLSGSSAGGLGAMYNFWLFQDAFGSVPGVLVDDSGPFFPISTTPALSFVLNTWNLAGTVAPGCDSCLDQVNPGGGLDNLIPYYAQKYPGHRGSLISSLQDDTISKYFYITADVFEAALNDLADTVVPQNPDFHVYYVLGTRHVWLDGDVNHHLSGVVSANVALSTFLQQELTADPAWSDVRP